MTRYVKVDVSPDEWPKDYWDKCRVCDHCGYKWPAPHLFNPSPCCDAQTTVIEDAPEIRWPEAVSKLLHARFDRWYEQNWAEEAVKELEELTKESSPAQAK